MRQYYGRSGRRRVNRWAFKRAITSINHCEATTATTGGTELLTTMFTALDAPTNRSTHIPAGAVLKSVLIRLFATDATPVAGKHQCGLWWRPGAMAFQGGLFTGWYASTDPITSVMVESRKYALQRNPHTLVTITGAAFPPRMTCFWRGNRVMRDGDDIVLAQLDAGSTAWYAECIAKYVH